MAASPTVFAPAPPWARDAAAWGLATRVGRAAYAENAAAQARRFGMAPSALRRGVDRLLTLAAWAMVPTGVVLVIGARRDTLVQELQSVETLARVDVVCFDKTGTLTEERFAVEDVEDLGAGVPYAAALAAPAAAETHPNATLQAIAARFPAGGDGVNDVLALKQADITASGIEVAWWLVDRLRNHVLRA